MSGLSQNVLGYIRSARNQDDLPYAGLGPLKEGRRGRIALLQSNFRVASLIVMFGSNGAELNGTGGRMQCLHVN